jgi:glucosamine 6-phosphate synthetase-like amidotransferase/phosphosugar isomerase protein
MCGIVGKYGVESPKGVVEICKNAWTETVHGGTDSYGAIYCVDGKVKYVKSLCKEKVLDVIGKEKSDIDWFIAHNRKASVGGVELKLAHPIISKKYGTLVIHNGTKRALAQAFQTESDTKALPIILNTISDVEVVKKLLAGIGVMFAVKITSNNQLRIVFHRDTSRTLYLNKEQKIFASEPIFAGKWSLVSATPLKVMKDLSELESLANTPVTFKRCNVCGKFLCQCKVVTSTFKYTGYKF